MIIRLILLSKKSCNLRHLTLNFERQVYQSPIQTVSDLLCDDYSIFNQYMPHFPLGKQNHSVISSQSYKNLVIHK